MYKKVQKETALGICYHFTGPGLNRYISDIHFQQRNNEWAEECFSKEDKAIDYDADKVLGMLQRAFEAGKKARSAELKKLIISDG